ncbi:MAG: YihY/virulence factor BrkB family protein [Bacteroidota bacterium]
MEDKLLRVPFIKWFIRFFQNIKIPGLEGMSLYDLFELYIPGIIKGALTARAGSIAFSFFLALFPFALFILTLIPYIPIEGFQEDFTAFILQSMPSRESAEAVKKVLFDIAENKYGELLSFGFILSMFLMTNGVNAIFSGFEYTYHQIETRTVIRQYMISFMVSLILVFLLLFTVVIIVTIGIILENLEVTGISLDNTFHIRPIQYFIMILMVYTAVSILFYFGIKEGKHISFFSAGSLFTTIFFIINFLIFSAYINKFGQYNKLYGSIGTVLVIMLFIWLNSIILLLGFELNTSLIKLHKKNISKSN